MEPAPNPYQPPQRWAAPPSGDEEKLRKLAIALLARRESPMGIGFYLRRVWRRELVLLVVFALSLWLMMSLEMFLLATGFGGFILGRTARDIRWYLALAQQWPMTSELVDWEKVERVAGEAEASPREGGAS